MKKLLVTSLFFSALIGQTPFHRSVLVENNAGHGSGIIISQDTVLTVFHNIQVDSDIRVNGKVAKIIKVDPKKDLCILWVKTPKQTIPFKDIFIVTLSELADG